MNPIYQMDLHDSIRINPYTYVLRVPGGWIYTVNSDNPIGTTSVFVPFKNEISIGETR